MVVDQFIVDDFNRGVENKYNYMIVWCDTFSYEYYPTYYKDLISAQFDKLKVEKNMQKFIYLFDLSKSIEGQI